MWPKKKPPTAYQRWEAFGLHERLCKQFYRQYTFNSTNICLWIKRVFLAKSMNQTAGIFYEIIYLSYSIGIHNQTRATLLRVILMKIFHNQKGYFFFYKLPYQYSINKKIKKTHRKRCCYYVFFRFLSYETEPSVIRIWNFIEAIWKPAGLAAH